jgi:iron complex outermembrane recepter protein
MITPASPTRACLLAALCASATAALAQPAAAPAPPEAPPAPAVDAPAPPAAPQAAPSAAAALEPVVISVSGVERRAFETPYAVGVVSAEELRAGGLMVNLSESLVRVPGITVNMRHNYAQDLQISSRGFGARSAFGVRGIRLYTDGVPASTPDGQGSISHFDIAGASRIEVLRGPFSALYGNSSGGVISLISTAPTERSFQVGADVGSDGTWQWRIGAEAPFGNGWDLRVQGSRFETDGFRPHSEARRDLANVRVGWRGELDTVLLTLNSLDQPAQDPLGLTRAQFDADPYQTTPQAEQFNTRKTVEQTQLGLQWKHRFATSGALQDSEVTLYRGKRGTTQWQAIPVATQAPPAHPGGVIDFDREYFGIDARLIWRWEQALIVAGVSADQQDEDRRGFENFIGTPPSQELGVTGALRRKEDNRVRGTDLYAQAEVGLLSTVGATLGVRSGKLSFRSRDHFLANGDDSGDLEFRYTNPVVALQWKPKPSLNVYVSAGRGFESPTLTELAYRPDGLPGPNTALRPQRSRQVEIGAKWRDAALGLNVDVALFNANTSDEIGVQTNAGGRSTFQNVGSTRRQGLEVGARWSVARDWRAQVAITMLDATYSDSFLTCAAVPCTAPTVVVPAGNRIAGTAEKSAFTELAWRPFAKTEFAAEVRAQGGIVVNDLNSDQSKSAVIVALRAGHALALPIGQLDLLARIDNLTDQRYAGSVIVNEANARYFETAAPRSWLLAAHWRVGF